MSRIGKQLILIPKGVEVKIDGQKVSVKGPKGELAIDVRPEIKIELKDDSLVVAIKKETKDSKAFWGLFRSLIANMVEGVTQGFQKQLQLEGVGYRARVEGNDLVLELGFSHLIKMAKPENIEFAVENNIITITGIDKGKVGQIAAKIRAKRPPEPYKGKGVRYVGEHVRRKEGKKAVGATA